MKYNELSNLLSCCLKSLHSLDVKADTLHKDLCSSKLANCDWSKLWFPLHRKITFQLYDALTLKV